MRAFMIFVFATITGMFIGSNQALAWGEVGHLTVCDLAYRNLTDPAKAEVKRLFRENKGGITVKDKEGMPKRHYTSFNVGCLEEDAFPQKNQDDHFVNVDRKTKTIDGTACPVAATCVFTAIQRDFDELKNTSLSDEDRVFALMGRALDRRHPSAAPHLVRG